MNVCYYTTIDTLALIVESRKIRFSRLDHLDDLKEAEQFAAFNPLQFIFAFCLPKDENENIPLWKMYSDLKHGVRITFNKDTIFRPTVKSPIIPPHFHEIVSYPQSIVTSLQKKDIINNDFLCSFYNSEDNIIQFRPIQYDDSFQDKYRDWLSIKDIQEKGSTTRTISYKPEWFGFYKTKYWAFQDEVRFLIYTIPFALNNNGISQIVSNTRYLTTEYIDVPLSDECLNNMIITLSPHATLASRVIVEQLTSKLETVQILDSELKNHLRE